MKDKIKQAIKTTLVIKNKTSIDICVDKIEDIFKKEIQRQTAELLKSVSLTWRKVNLKE